MKQFEDWWPTRYKCTGKWGCWQECEAIAGKAAFKAGMKAAADIAKDFQNYKFHDDKAVAMAYLIEQEIKDACKDEE